MPSYVAYRLGEENLQSKSAFFQVSFDFDSYFLGAHDNLKKKYFPKILHLSLPLDRYIEKSQYID